MITTLLSVLVASLVFFVVYGFFGLTASILPAVAALLVTFFLISRNLAKKIEASMKGLQDLLLKGQADKAIVELKAIKSKFGRWQFFLSSTIDGQIGSIYYMKGQFQKAKSYLERSFVRHWVAKAMLALVYYRERKMDKMNETFEYTTRYVKKAGLLWSLWAYCTWRNGDIEGAIKILARGKEHLKEADPNLLQNLLSLQNDKRMKMRAYGEQWYQFQLELSPQQVQMKRGAVRFQNR